MPQQTDSDPYPVIMMTGNSGRCSRIRRKTSRPLPSGKR